MTTFHVFMSKHAALRSDIELQAHQRDLIHRARTIGRGGVIANWRTGGGKTPGSIAVAEDRGGKALAIVPAALRENYRQGVRKFTTDDRHDDYHIMSYEQFIKNPNIVKDLKPKTVILDEYHRMRNPGKAREALTSVRKDIPFVVANTASLINNRPEELVPLVNLVAGKRVYGEDEFQRKHLGVETVRSGGILGRIFGPTGVKEKIKNQDELRRRMGPYVHQFKGTAGFDSHFPEKKEEDIVIPMSKEQDKLYRAILNSNPALAAKIKKNLPPSKQDLANINAFSVALRQISNTPAAYNTALDAVNSSPKLQEMIRRQHEAAKADPNFRSVVYSNFLNAGVVPVVDRMRSQGVPSQVFQGGMTDKQRAELVKDFNAGKIKTLGVSPAGGEGLDLKGVKMIQLTEPHWNPERHEQAIGRGVRFKSHEHLPREERNVAVQRYISAHPESVLNKIKLTKRDTSIDEWMLSRMKEKKELNDSFIQALS